MPPDAHTTIRDDQSHLRLRGSEFIKLAGASLAGWLTADPLQIDNATPLELAAVEHAKGRTFLKRIDARAGQIEREQARAASAAKPRVAYPTLNAHVTDL